MFGAQQQQQVEWWRVGVVPSGKPWAFRMWEEAYLVAAPSRVKAAASSVEAAALASSNNNNDQPVVSLEEGLLVNKYDL